MNIHYIHYPSNETRSGEVVRSLRPTYNMVEVLRPDGMHEVVHYSNIITGRLDVWRETMAELLSIPSNLEYVLLIGRP